MLIHAGAAVQPSVPEAVHAWEMPAWDQGAAGRTHQEVLPEPLAVVLLYCFVVLGCEFTNPNDEEGAGRSMLCLLRDVLERTDLTAPCDGELAREIKRLGGRSISDFLGDRAINIIGEGGDKPQDALHQLRDEQQQALRRQSQL